MRMGNVGALVTEVSDVYLSVTLQGTRGDVILAHASSSDLIMQAGVPTWSFFTYPEQLTSALPL